MLFSDLSKITEGRLSIQNDAQVKTFATDTRTLTGHPDEVFVAIKGQQRDGHSFISSAIKKGVQNFIVESEISDQSINQFIVKDSLASFQQIASSHRQQFTYPIIGITGSNGKTTVKEWLSSLLSEKYHVIKSPKSYNSQIGVPLSIMAMRSHHEIGIFEAGISRKGEMQKLSKIILPDIGIFTTLGSAHDDGFQNQEEKLKEKLALFQYAKKVICRSDVPWFPIMKNALEKQELLTWSLSSASAVEVHWDKGVITVDGLVFHTHFLDTAALENATHSIIASLNAGLSQKEIQKGLNNLLPIPMRLELKKGINGCYILDDTYNNDIEGLKVAMDYMDGQQQNSSKTLILSDIVHAGQPDESTYQQVASILMQKGFDRLIGIGPGISANANQFSGNAHFYSDTAALLQNLPAFRNEMILVKGARNFALEKVVQSLAEQNHGTVLEVNFEKMQHNLNQYRTLLKKETRLMVMVKANAYGAGLLEVANFLQHKRIDQLGVAYVDEAIQLRNNGITIPIMIMNPHVESFVQFEKYDLQPEIFSFRHLDQFLDDTTNPTPIHLKIDTGMHRLGFPMEQVSVLCERLKLEPKLKVASIFTHFAASDDPNHDSFTQKQAVTFEQAYDAIAHAIGYKPIKHACNSPAMVRWPQCHFDMVRLGIGLHGFDPTQALDLKMVSTLNSTISQVQEIKKGETVGYSRKGTVERDSRVAIIPIGYEDGFLRVFGNKKAEMLINDTLYPTIGNVCMDMTMLDVTGSDVKEGDQVTIFGESPTINDLAKTADTIPYEILTNISSRVKRVFISE